MLLDFIPLNSKIQIKNLLVNRKIMFIVKSKRKTKHGDFKILGREKTQITINKTINKYQFLITLLHELAHYDTYVEYGNKVKPHGVEWKKNFRLLMLPFLNSNIFPEEILKNLSKYIKNPKASTDNDFDLIMSLKKFNPNDRLKFVCDLKEGDIFNIDSGKKFKIIRKKVKRYECLEIKTGRKYLFSPQVGVNIV